jgi:hypothetical protein
VAEHSGSLRVIIAAIAGNVAIAICKFGAALVSGSAAMYSEAVHSTVDTGNELLLLFGMRRADKPPDAEHPFGYGLQLYFWVFVVAVMIFGLEMDDTVRVALVGDHPGELVGDAETPLRLSKQHHPAVRGDPPAIEGGADLLARYRWKVERQQGIFVHRSLRLLDRCAASTRGIMPHLRLSDYGRPTARTSEVTK